MQTGTLWKAIPNWYGSCISSVNGKPICTHTGTDPFGPVLVYTDLKETHCYNGKHRIVKRNGILVAQWRIEESLKEENSVCND